MDGCYHVRFLGSVADAMIDLAWMEEKIPKLPRGNWLYKTLCLLTFRKNLSYKEYYMIILEVNKKKIGEQLSKEKAIRRTLSLYKELNGKYPENYDD